MTCSIDKLVAKIASKFHDCPEDELESIEQEIAELLDITASASRSQLTRAKKLLRSLLKESEENISI